MSELSTGVSASFARKGRTLRRRCGQPKVVERHLRRGLLAVRGLSPAALPRRGRLQVPSPGLVRHMLAVLERISVSSVEREDRLVITESSVVFALEEDPGLGSSLRGLLFDLALSYIVLDEQCRDLCSPSTDLRQATPETRLQRAVRMVAGCSLLIRLDLCAEITVLVMNESDPVVAACKDLGLTWAPVTHFLRSEGWDSIAEEAEFVLSGLVSGHVSAASEDYPAHLSPTEIGRGVSSGEILLGTLTTYRHNCLEGEVEVGDAGPLFLVRGRRSMNRALDGDRVFIRRVDQPCEAIEAQEEGELRGHGRSAGLPFAEVVGIQKRSIGRVIASLNKRSLLNSDEGKVEYLLVNPADKKLPRFRIRTRQRQLLEEKRFVIAFDNWPRDSKYPNGAQPLD